MQDNTLLLDLFVASTRFNSALQRAATALLDDAGLTVPQWLMLCHLRQATAGTLTEIATTLSRDIGGLSRAAHLLQKRQLIAITRGEEDRRSVGLSISAPGIALCESLDRRMAGGLVGTLHAAVGQPSLQALRQLLEGAAASLNVA